MQKWSDLEIWILEPELYHPDYFCLVALKEDSIPVSERSTGGPPAGADADQYKCCAIREVIPATINMGSVLPGFLPFLGDEGHTMEAVGNTVFNIYQNHITTYLEVPLKSRQPRWPP